MPAQLRARLTHANVMSSIAVFLALGGGAYAIAIPAGSVGTRQLRDGAVTSNKLRARAVTRGRIARNAITSSRVRDRSLVARDSAQGQLPGGPRGPAGPAGATGARGPTGASALDPVPSGQIIRGAVGGDFHAFGAGASDSGSSRACPCLRPTA